MFLLKIIFFNELFLWKSNNNFIISVVLSDGFAKVQSFFDGEAKKKLILGKKQKKCFQI